MIELISGLPGAGKSLRGVERIVSESLAPVRRAVFVYGLDGLREELATRIADPLKWEQLPDGALIVIDEAQKVFPIRRGGEPIPPIAALSEHRHRGFDFLLITQHPNLLDVYVRRLVGKHTHVLRRFNGHTCQLITWGEAVDDPQSMGTRARGTTAIWRYPKQLFNAYKSATLHTHKSRFPLRLVLVPVVLLALVICGYFINGFFSREARADETNVADSSTDPVKRKAVADAFAYSPQSGASERRLLTPEEYALQHIPRLPGLVYSAPVFDHRQAIAEPRLLCASTPYKCACITEQGTRAQIDYVQCRTIALNGYYDPYRAPQEVLPPQSAGQSPASPASANDVAQRQKDGRSVDVQGSAVRPFVHASAGQPGRYTHIPAEPAL